MQVVNSSIVIHRGGYTRHKEPGAVIRRDRVIYEHVREPVSVPRPKIEDFSALVVVHDKMEYYS